MRKKRHGKIKYEKNRVHPQEIIDESILRIPFLQKFFNKKNPSNVEVAVAINEYVGYNFEALHEYDDGSWGFPYKKINELLELAEKRGDL